MKTISLQVIQGLERGQCYPRLRVPFTIGREEENAIQLNDERISRCHVKVQQDGDRVILTDLQSTNGTRVNGLPVQMTVLRPGDLITIGRCVLLFGSPEEITEHCDELHRNALEHHRLIDTGNTLPEANADLAQDEHGAAGLDTMGLFDDHGHPAAPFPGGRPPLPDLTTLHSRSELSDLLAYVHNTLLQVLQSRDTGNGNGEQKSESVDDSTARLPWPSWQKMLELETELAEYLRELGDPDHE